MTPRNRPLPVGRGLLSPRGDLRSPNRICVPRRWEGMDSKFRFPDAHVTLTGVYASRTR